MGWVRDNTGRFSRRPYYQQSFLDRRCERLICEFLQSLYGQVTIPVPNGALIKLVERDARDLNLYAQLPEGVLGVTYFDPPRKPQVRIARSLFEDTRRLHRLRFTLAHEYAHVVLHAPLYLKLGSAAREDHQCTTTQIEPLAAVDWMEWQASYAAGALLMPASRLRALVDACRPSRLGRPPAIRESLANNLQQRTSEAFLVSTDAARVRLTQLGYLSDRPPQ
jgi:hypothetical protein